MIKKPLFHVPLQPLGSRYTEYLQQIEERAFEPLLEIKAILPASDLGVAADIVNGRVLDNINRPRWAMAQIDQLLKGPTDLGAIYFSDFYHPGLETLAYAKKSFTAYSFLWAQTFDRFDFTMDHIAWMRIWEVMALGIYAKVFVACPLLKELIVTAIPEAAGKIDVVGLPFDSNYVRSLLSVALCPADPFDVVYSSRWDEEKNPQFFIELVKSNPNLKFAVCTGRGELTGTDTSAVKAAIDLEAAGRLTIFRGLTKPHYLAILSRSKVQFNCGWQDWISYTLLEGLTMGCTPLYPNHRSFPEALHYSEPHLYQPFNLNDTNRKLRAILNNIKGSGSFDYRADVLAEHDLALNRIATTINEGF